MVYVGTEAWLRDGNPWDVQLRAFYTCWVYKTVYLVVAAVACRKRDSHRQTRITESSVSWPPETDLLHWCGGIWCLTGSIVSYKFLNGGQILSLLFGKVEWCWGVYKEVLKFKYDIYSDRITSWTNTSSSAAGSHCYLPPRGTHTEVCICSRVMEIKKQPQMEDQHAWTPNSYSCKWKQSPKKTYILSQTSV